jgi:coenzyme PQQ precursor peptide PqqA
LERPLGLSKWRSAMAVKKEWVKPEICEADVGMEVTGYQSAETETETEVLF